ncbi:nedd8-activating enzyme e1 regulatory subunit-like protein [Lasius niger]|uniref:NEDD8-activating enzyme E1 regulatory subunit n=1 Tax=Lasius niger TaxID=67767 RepID=A0A0J7KFZ2_LASNI|nr:nedd8-activating enzyme e1 regulatory subunit-like protein [Lasius niger]
MASPESKSPEQSEKNRKYDRQLRLWGDHGQATLEAAHVCLINATGLGTEILKSLVLPGIGAFTIVDGKKITVEDIEPNFFLEADSVGKSRAQVATEILLELNPDVTGDYIDEEPEQILSNSPDFFNSFTVVVATALTEKTLVLLSKRLWELDIPLIVCRSIGFIAYMRIQIKEHTVIETHPDNETPDLRLDRPFDSLKKHLDSINLNEMSFKDHCHVPYLIILYKYLEKWILEHRALPKLYKDKQQLRDMIKSGIRRDEHDSSNSEENFEEAMKAVNTFQNLETPESMMIYYVMLRGVDKFQAEYNSYPGEFDDQVEPDIVKLKTCLTKLLSEWGCGPLAKDDYVHEFCRFGGAELHSVSAFLGGLAAQETIKLITNQYKPVHNTFIYDAVTSNSGTFFF